MPLFLSTTVWLYDFELGNILKVKGMGRITHVVNVTIKMIGEMQRCGDEESILSNVLQ